MRAGNISSKSNLTQQDPSDLSTSQSLKTYYFRDETIHRDQMSGAFGKLELLQRCFQLPPSFHLRWLHLESAELFHRVLLHPVIVKPKSAPYYCFPELSSSCSRVSSAPPRTTSYTMAILAEPFHSRSTSHYRYLDSLCALHNWIGLSKFNHVVLFTL